MTSTIRGLIAILLITILCSPLFTRAGQLNSDQELERILETHTRAFKCHRENKLTLTAKNKENTIFYELLEKYDPEKLKRRWVLGKMSDPVYYDQVDISAEQCRLLEKSIESTQVKPPSIEIKPPMPPRYIDGFSEALYLAMKCEWEGKITKEQSQQALWAIGAEMSKYDIHSDEYKQRRSKATKRAAETFPTAPQKLCDLVLQSAGIKK